MSKKSSDKKKTPFNIKMYEWRRSESYNTIANNFIAILGGSLLIQLLFFLVSLMTKNGLMIIHIIVEVIIVLSFVLFKDGVSEGSRRIGAWFFKTSFLTTPLFILNGFIISGYAKLNNPTFAKPMTMLAIALNITIFILYIGLLVKPEVKEWFAVVETKSLWDKLEDNIPEEVNIGDALVGKRIKISFKDNGDKVYDKTDLPVVLPIKDRYLHMLILGPTGSGKTSQVLIPLIYRDIQNKDLGIIVMEPKGDLAEKVFAMGRHLNREVQYFNPVLPDCPFFNPLFGVEEDVIENMATTFKMLGDSNNAFFANMGENLIRNSLKVLKRLYKNDATMLDLYTLVHNNENKGKKIVQEFSRLQVETRDLQKENEDIVSWFLSDYFTGSTGDAKREATKTYEHCSGIRAQIAQLVSNKYLRKVFNPPAGHGSDIDFDDALERGTVIAIATAQGKLRELGRFLGYFLILQLQSSVFKRPGNENTRRGCMLYIDEFQVYANKGFSDMLTQGRSYRVASHLATQARAQIGMGQGKDGQAFIDLVSSNARNVIVYPGGNFDDAKFYSDQFGTHLLKTIKRGTSQQKMGLGNLAKFRPTNESVQANEKLESLFTPSDIIYRPFGEITYLFIKNNSIQRAEVASIEYIPREINDMLDQMISDYNDEQDRKASGVYSAKEDSEDIAHSRVNNEDFSNQTPVSTHPSREDEDMMYYAGEGSDENEISFKPAYQEVMDNEEEEFMFDVDGNNGMFAAVKDPDFLLDLEGEEDEF